MLLLPWIAALTFGGCLWPPEFKVRPDDNLPVTIDEAKIEVKPGFYVWQGCEDTFDLDITLAIDNPDDDELFIVWIVNYEPGLGESVDALDTETFSFDPCLHPKTREGGLTPNTIEVHVLDRKPVSLNNADDAQTAVPGSVTTMAEARWFVAVEDRICCQQ